MNACAPLRYYDCVSIFTPENLTGGYFYSAMWLVIYLKRAVIGNHFHVFRQFFSSSKWQVILPVGEIGPIFYWEARQFLNSIRSLMILCEVNGLCVWGHLQKMRLQRWLITEVHKVSGFQNSLPGFSVMILHTLSSDNTTCQELKLNFLAFIAT